MLRKIYTAAKNSWSISKEQQALPFMRQVAEMTVLLVRYKLGPGVYHRYRLWDRDIPWAEKKDYWYFEKYENFVNQANPMRYRFLGRNKIVAKALLSFYDLPDPEYLGHVLERGTTLPPALRELGARNLEQALLLRQDLEQICFKPVEGAGGEGFSAAYIERTGDSVTLVDCESGTRYSCDDYLTTKLTPIPDGYLIERYIDQHPDLAVFNSSSINTLRVWIGKNRSHEIRIIGIFLRVGRAGSLVDNRGGGGFGLALDPETFKTSLAIPQDGEGLGFSQHPDSGIEMPGRTIPFKEEIEALSFAIMEIIPGTQFAGLDIAVTPDGPIFIEFNLAPTATGANVFKRSHKSLLGWILEP